MSDFEFEAFPKIPRLKKEVVVTEKIDGTNAQIALFEVKSEEDRTRAFLDPKCLIVFPGAFDGDSAMALYVGSRNRWLTRHEDNFGFCNWVLDRSEEIVKLGPGRHFGEWYGKGIQRGYGLDEKRFALFNVARWNSENPNRPSCCEVVPLIARGDDISIEMVMSRLQTGGSIAVPGFMNPEGIVVYHTASRQMYKRTFEQDKGKWT